MCILTYEWNKMMNIYYKNINFFYPVFNKNDNFTPPFIMIS